MKIDLSKEVDADTFLGWLVCQLPEPAFTTAFDPRSGNSPNPRITEAEVKLTVNGVELDPRAAFKRLYTSYQEAVAKAVTRGALDAARRVLGDACELKLKEHWQREMEEEQDG